MQGTPRNMERLDALTQTPTATTHTCPNHDTSVVPRARVVFICQGPPARLLGRDRVPSTPKPPKTEPLEPETRTSLGLSRPHPSKTAHPPQRLTGQLRQTAPMASSSNPQKAMGPDISPASVCPHHPTAWLTKVRVAQQESPGCTVP